MCQWMEIELYWRNLFVLDEDNQEKNIFLTKSYYQQQFSNPNGTPV